MRSGPDHRSRRYNGKKPFQPQQRMPSRGQVFDSNGPNVKIRGNAHQIFERYAALAREAETSGDRIAAENLYQHAEHYLRVSNASRDGNPQGAPRPTTPADVQPDRFEAERSDPEIERSQPRPEDDPSGGFI